MALDRCRAAALLPLVLSMGRLDDETPQEPDPGPRALTAEERAAGWRLLFDGKTLAGWRGFRLDRAPASWKAVDGVLSFSPGGERGDLVTAEEFGDFDLSLEWRITKGGNSGILFRVTEDRETTWATGPEFQVLDNDLLGEEGDPRTSAGANYGLHAPARDVARPPGSWNEARIVARGSHVEHWLNGEKIVEYEIGSEAWKGLVAASKFGAMPGYGRNSKGRIALQDHGDPVAYRNLRIRPLPSEAEGR